MRDTVPLENENSFPSRMIWLANKQSGLGMARVTRLQRAETDIRVSSVMDPFSSIPGTKMFPKG
jgi:hypothetical protein